MKELQKLALLLAGMILLLPLALIAAGTPPANFPLDDAVFSIVILGLGFLVPWLLGKTKFKTWKRQTKTVLGYLISAVVAGLAMLVAKLTTGSWPFENDWWKALATGWAWVQFCYEVFVKGWILKAEEQKE